MNKLVKHMKHHPYIYGGIFVLITLVFFPIIIWLCYYVGDLGLVLITTSLSAGDILGYYGTCLTFIGTTFLGIVAYKQNDFHNKAAADFDNANTQTPYLTICEVGSSSIDATSALFERSHYKIKGTKATVKIKNIGQGIATHLFYKHWFGKLHNPEDQKMDINLGVEDSFEIPIRVREEDVNNIKQVTISYQNIIGFRYQQSLSYKLVNEVKESKENEFEDEFFLHIYLMGNQQRLGTVEDNITGGCR